MSVEFLNGRVIVKTGDITAEDVDAIVNAANASLLGGGGVDGAIHARGGPEILKECRAIRATRYPEGLPTGHSVATSAGRLRSRYVIHTVGPVYGQHNGMEDLLLGNCYRSSIRLANELGLSSLAFPAVSTGVYGFPKAEAAKIASVAITEELSAFTDISQVRLVFFSPSDAGIFLENTTLI